MSHFTRVKTQIKSYSRLKQVLEELEYSYTEAKEENLLLINGWDKAEQQVQLEIKTGCQYSVGVIQEGETLQFVADWWGLETYTGIKQHDFINKITQKYAYDTVLEKIKEKGYNIVTEEVDKKQNIRLIIRKWE